MGETRTHHFYGFGIFEAVTKPQNQLFLSLGTPRHLKEIKKHPWNILTYYYVFKSRNFETPKVRHLSKRRAPINDEDLSNKHLEHLGYGTNIFLKT